MILDAFRLDGRTALVTGGTGLYGRLIATALLEAGARVVVTSRDERVARETAADLTRSGGEAVGTGLDLSDTGRLTALAERIDDTTPVDILINNAVHRQGTGFFGTTAEDWAATSKVNSLGTFLLTQAIAERMTRRRSGSIVFVGSIYGLVAPDPGVYAGTDMSSPAFYAYDKAGMVGLTRYLASYLGPDGVRVNSIAPGGLQTDQDPTFVAQYEQRTPLGRMAAPGDVEGAIVFLASDAARYITGANLPVDGGWTCR